MRLEFPGEQIVQGLLSANTKQQRGIVILHDSEGRSVKEERIEFIKGDPSQDEDLIRAGIMKASNIIVLTYITKGANDAEALIIPLAVKSLHREVHTCV